MAQASQRRGVKSQGVELGFVVSVGRVQIGLKSSYQLYSLLSKFLIFTVTLGGKLRKRKQI